MFQERHDLRGLLSLRQLPDEAHHLFPVSLAMRRV
jgi:hypothetical protein